MAIVSAGFELSITLVDNGGNSTTLSWQANPAVVTDYATAQAQRDLLVADLAAISNSVISGTRLAEVEYEDSLAYPVAGVENEDKASITYLIQDTNKKGNLKVPAPDIDIFVNASGPSANVVDVGDALVIAYTDNFRTTGGWLVSDGESLQTVLKGKRISAKNNNG